MFALYNYKAGSTKANILADIGKILTGTTDLAQLSTDCGIENSTITAQYDPAGWSIHDANCGTGQLCIKAPCLDGVTFKYVILDMNTLPFTFKCYETWNASTHTGTNPVYFSNGQPYISELQETYLTTATGGYIFLYASAQELIFNFKGSGGWASQVGNRFIVEEFTRMSVNMDIARGYPCWCPMAGPGAVSAFKSPRLKNPVGNGDAVTTNEHTSLYASSMLFGSTSKRPPAYRDSITETNYETIFPMSESLIIQTSRYDAYQQFDAFDVLGYLCTKGIATDYEAGNTLDELIYNGKTYICYGTYGIHHSQINNWFPKG